MSEYPVMKNQIPVGSILNFTSGGEKYKYKVLSCDGIAYGENGYTLECVCTQSPSESMVGKAYTFDDRAFRAYNENNIVVEYPEDVRYKIKVGLFTNNVMIEIPDSMVFEFNQKEVSRLKNVLAKLKEQNLNSATLPDELKDLKFFDEDEDEFFIADDFAPGRMTVYSDGMMEIEMECLTKDGTITTDAAINLYEAMAFFGLEENDAPINKDDIAVTEITTVIVMNRGILDSAKSFVNSKDAEEFFTLEAKKIEPGISAEDVEACLDNGYFENKGGMDIFITQNDLLGSTPNLKAGIIKEESVFNKNDEDGASFSSFPK